MTCFICPLHLGQVYSLFWFVCFAWLLKSRRLKHVFFLLPWFLLILRNCMFNLKKIQGNHIYVFITLIVKMCLSFEVGSGGQCKVFSGRLLSSSTLSSEAEHGGANL